MSGTLSEEQLRRIEENKRRALAKRAQSQKQPVAPKTASPVVVSLPPRTASVFNQGASNTCNQSTVHFDKNHQYDVGRQVRQKNLTDSSVSKGENDVAFKVSKDLNVTKKSDIVIKESNVVFEKHKVGAPNVEKHKVDAPNVEKHTVGTPNVEKHTVGTPNVEKHKVGTPNVENHKVGAPNVENQKVGTPNVEKHKVGTPNVEKHKVGAPNVPESTLSAAQVIEQKRLKALALRAEKLNKSPIKDKQGTVGTFTGPSSSLAKTNAGYQQNLHHDTISNKQPQIGSGLAQKDFGSFAQNSNKSSDFSKTHSSAIQLSAACNGPQQSNSWNAFGGLMQGNVKGDCVLVSRERFEVKVGYSAPLIELFKTMETKLYEAVTKKWTFKLSEYNKFMSAVKVLKPAVDIEPLPRAILQAFSAQLRGENPSRDIPMANLTRVDPFLVNSLMSFQRTGVNFGVYKHGRVLIADDMGLGKTIQAICLACYYRSDWPLLVVVPSSVRYDWAQQFKRWVPSVDPETIHVVVTGKDSCTSGLVNIISYDLMARRADELKKKGFKLVIVDESHLLKNFKTARCKAALPLLQNARRVFLLSGTPALSRPSELYTQVSAVCPFMLKFHDFGVRYCDGKQLQWGWDFSGSSNMAELQLFLEETVMIRRLKKEVLSELPDKIRHMVMLDPGSIRINKELKSASKVMTGKLKSTEQTCALLDFFHKSGSAKLKAIKNYVDDLLEQEKKFLIFAHHGDVLDGIEETVKAKIDTNYMRIDGRTGSEQRNINCLRFQSKDSVRVAILSITAANAGLNLAAANLVVFAELFWNPGILVQAEDRAHRIGQQDSVSVQYLVATGTSDDTIWPMIQRKLDVLGKAGLTKDNFSKAETTRLKDPQQLEIEKFLEESFSEDFIQTTEEEEEPVDPEFQQQTSPSKVPKQQSILQYTSPVKASDINANETAEAPKPSVPRQQSILKYASPVKTSDTNTDVTAHATEPQVKKRKIGGFKPPYAKGET